MNLKTLILAFGLTALSTYPAMAELKIEITEGKVEPMPIAIPDFAGNGGPEAQAMGRQMAQVIAADLERSGLFRPIDPRAFIQDPASLQQAPKFADWKPLKTEALVTGVVESSPGSLKVSFRLFDVTAEEQMIGLSLNGDSAQWRRIAHKISDAIYSRITGEGGYFDTRIVYVNLAGHGKKTRKRLAIMDYDGENHRYITGGENFVMSPRFSPAAHEVTFMEFEGKKPAVHMLQTQTGQRRPIGHFPGLTFAPRFSPDGKSVIMSLAKNGATTLQKLDLLSGATTPLTSGTMIDTSPCYSPEGDKIVFNSDRGGTQQLYIMDSNGGGAERLSFGKGRYATPVWSPRGDWIAFTRIANGNFYVGVMHPDGTGERMLAQGYIVDSPTWAPNGRVIMYMKQDRGGVPKLYSVDVTGYNEREVPTPGGAEHPAWSPLIP